MPVIRKTTARINKTRGIIHPNKKRITKTRKQTNANVKCAIAVGLEIPHQGKAPPL